MIVKHPRLINKQHGTIKNYSYVGDVSGGVSLSAISGGKELPSDSEVFGRLRGGLKDA